MDKDILHNIHIEKTVCSISGLTEDPDEKDYWISKSPCERLYAVEIMRQIIYGYSSAPPRFQRVLEITELE